MGGVHARRPTGKRDRAANQAALTARVGQTPAERLARVVNFAERDLASLHDAETRALELDLLFIAVQAMPPAGPRQQAPNALDP